MSTIIGQAQEVVGPDSNQSEQSEDQEVNQTEEKKLIQFSGMIISEDTSYSEVHPIFYCHMRIKNRNRATISNLEGLFSIVVQPKDTILFSAIGYKSNYLIIPDSLPDNVYSVVHIMEIDTILLDEAVVYPWPTRENFKREFLALEVAYDPIAQYEKEFGKTLQLEYIAPTASDLSAGATFVISGPISAIADFIRDGDSRKMNRYRRKLGILDSIQQEQTPILPDEKDFKDRLKESFPLFNNPNDDGG